MSLDDIPMPAGSVVPREARSFRLIPRVECWEPALAFVETGYGRIFIALLFLFILKSFYGLGGPWLQTLRATELTIVIVSIFPISRKARLISAVVAALLSVRGIDFAVMLPAAARSPEILRVMSEAKEQTASFPLKFAAAVLLLSLSLIFATIHLATGHRSRFFIVWPLCCWATLVGFGSWFGSSSPAGLVVWGVISFYSSALFPLAYVAASAPSASGRPGITQLIYSLQNVLAHSRFTFLRSPDAILERIGSRDLARVQIKAVKLLLWTRLLLLVREQLQHLVSERLGWPSFIEIGFAAYNSRHIAPMQSWAMVLLTNLYFLCTLCIVTGVPVALLRLMGFYLPRGVYRPHLAMSFNDYFRRILFYYSEVLTHIFFYPIFLRLNGMRRRKTARISIALFLAVFAGGLVYHTVLVWQEFLFFGSMGALGNILSWVPYFLLMATACCFSNLKRAVFPEWLPWPIRFCALFSLHSFFMVLIQYGARDTWADRFRFIASLFAANG